MSVDFKSALEKARAVAAKLNQGLTPAASVSPANLNPTSTVNYTNTINNGSSNGTSSLKRHLDDDDSIVGNLKKMAYSNTSLSNDSNSSNMNIKQNKQNNIHNANMPQKSSNGNTIFKPSQIFLDGCIQNGEKILDILIPGQKVGFVIGKGGDMIRQLQERANVKMTIIQQSSEVSDSNKQLRIVGDPNKVDNAHQMVKELLVEKEMEMMKYKNKSQQPHQNNNHSASNEYGSMPQNYVEIPVSPQYIGLVIGKGGENIKRISQETGAKVTVDVSKTDSNGNKLCQISANNPNSLNIAADMVRDMLNNAMSNKRAPQPGTEEVKISVPQNKTGIVIGKGGETIRAIKQQCGCNIELEKNSKGIFNIRGTSDRIQYAQQIIGEKIGGQSLITVLSSTIQNNQQAAASAYADPYSWAATQAQFAYPQIPNTTSAATNPAAAGTQDNAAAWAAYSQYYSQYYSQMQQQMAQQQQLGQTTPATGQEGPQEDYTKQWIAYYRAVGMEEEAQKLENMEKQKKSAQSAVTANPT